MTNLAIPLSRWLFDVYCLSTVLFAVALLCSAWLSQPARRIQVARATLLLVVAITVLAAIPNWPRLRLNWIDLSRAADASHAQVGMSVEERPIRATTSQPASTNPIAARAPAGSSGRAFGRSLNALEWISIGFLTLASLTAAWLLLGRLLVNRILMTSRPAAADVLRLWRTLGGAAVRRIVGVFVADTLGQPVAVGAWRPVILLPPAIQRDQAACHAALAHEWEHIRRGDLWVLALCRWMNVVFFAHPLYWWLLWRMRFDQELVADRAAARSSDPITYAELLVRWSQQSTPKVFLAGQVLAMVGGVRLKGRVASLLHGDSRHEDAPPRQWTQSVLGGLATVAVALSALTMSGAGERSSAAATNPSLAGVRPADIRVINVENSVAVEVIALRSHPCDGAYWWDVNGNLIAAEGNRRSAPLYPPEVIIRIRAEAGDDWRPDASIARPLDDSEWDAVSHLDASDGPLFAVRMNTDGDAFELPLTKADWTTRSLSTCASFSGGDDFKYFPCTDTDELIVSVTHSLSADEQMKVVAMDRTGDRHTPSRTSMAPGELTAVFENLDPADAQCFYVQTRPLLRVGLNRLPTRPRLLTEMPAAGAGLDPVESQL